MIRRTLLSLLLVSPLTLAKGLSPYLPLNLSPEVETLVDKVMALTDGAPLSRPYKAADLLSRLAQIKTPYPLLYARMQSYMQRYERPIGRTHLSVVVSGNSGDNVSLANKRGETTDTHAELTVGGFAFINPYMYVATGVRWTNEHKLQHFNTHLGLGSEYAQVEIGYREHWFSPMHDSAMLISTNAAPSPSVTLSNSTPLTSLGLRYTIFYSRLAKTTGINMQQQQYSGQPNQAGWQLSIAPLPNWTIGVSRTLMFSGGKPHLGSKDTLSGWFNPGWQPAPPDELTTGPVGNQMAAISSQIELNPGMPVTLYGEYARQDQTTAINTDPLSRTAISWGVYLPVLTDNLALRIESSHWSGQWYQHPAYPEGYSNKGNIMGSWAVAAQQGAGAAQSVRLDWSVASQQLISVHLRHQSGTNTTDNNGHELALRYSYATNDGFIGGELTSGQTPKGLHFTRLSIFYRW